MDAHDWRAELFPHIRRRVVEEITNKLKLYQSRGGGDDESLEVQKTAQSFEQKTYADAASQEDYLQKISSMKNLIIKKYWRSLLQPGSRQRIVNKITETLERHIPYSGQEGLDELHKTASRFEETIYNSATSQPDYLRKISLKMLTIETRSQNTIANSLASNLGNNGDGPSDTEYWRSLLQPGSRQRIVNKITETLKRHIPYSGQEGLDELHRTASRFEEKIYNSATSQSDYLRKISLKMLTMETRSQNTIAISLASNLGNNGDGPSDTGRRL